MNKIIKKVQYSEKVFRFDVEAPLIAKSRKAGNFVIIRVDNNSERMPLTIADADIEKGTITLVVQKVGLSSTKLCALNEGDEIHDVVGPLGNPTHIENFGTVICAGGGVGVAPMLPIIKALKAAGNRVLSVIAGRNKDLVIMEDEVRASSDELIIMTDDGSYGEKGVVTVGIEKFINQEHIDKVFAIGPPIMMKFCCLLTQKYNLSTDVSLNTIMVDGTGMCGACRLTIGGKTKFVCIDGPEFDGALVDWDEMFKRMGTFKDVEREEMEHFEEHLATVDAVDCPKPTCMEGCPVSINIPSFIKNIERGQFLAAAKVLKNTSALPAVCGRVCPQEKQCESKCVHLKMNEPAVAIGYLERFAADYERQSGNISVPKCDEPNGIKIAVVGSGPSGLSFAGDMAKKGFDVTVFEALHEIGGVLKYGIPEFRLPNAIVDVEIKNLQKMGVKFITDCIVGKTISVKDLEEQGFKGIFVGSGAGLPNFMNIPGENALNIMSSNEYLTRVNLMDAANPHSDTPINLGKKVVVVGGGNTAMDSCRTAKRLGADVTLVYRRSEAEMPARLEEVKHAKEEGINFFTLHNPKEYEADDKGAVKAVVLDVMKLGEPDASGRRRPEATGETITLECDQVIVAVGVSPNPLVPQSIEGLELGRKNTIAVNDQMQSSIEEIYAGGDIVRGGATVILAMGDGRKAALNMSEKLLNKK